MGGEQHGGTPGSEVAKKAVDPVASRKVDADGRLVEDQDGRLVEGGGGEIDPTLLASGQGSHPAVGPIGQIDPGQGSRHRGCRGGARQTGQLPQQAEVFGHGQLLVERDLLGNQTKRPAGGGIDAGIPTGYRHGAGVEAEPAGQRPYEAGLPGAVRTEQAVDLAGVDREVDAVKTTARAVRPTDVARCEDRGHRGGN